MLQSQTTHTSSFIAAFDLLANGEDISPVLSSPGLSMREPSRPNSLANPPKNLLANPMLVPSVAETAGLSRFVYIVGQSKHRYVFSSIRKSQISLYSEAVFVVNGEVAPMWVGDYSSLIAHLNNAKAGYTPRIFVHLLAESDMAKSHVISDLSCPADSLDCWKRSAA